MRARRPHACLNAIVLLAASTVVANPASSAPPSPNVIAPSPDARAPSPTSPPPSPTSPPPPPTSLPPSPTSPPPSPTDALGPARSDALAPARLDPAALDRDYRRARLRRNVGISLTVPLVATTLIGLVVFGYYVSDIGDNKDPNLISRGTKIEVSAIVAGASLLLSIPGIYLWESGQNTMDGVTWRRRQTELTLSTAVAPAPGGAVATMTLRF